MIMNKHSSYTTKRTLTVQDWMGRAVFAALFIGAITLVIFGRNDDSSLLDLRQSTSNTLSSLSDFISSPIDGVIAITQSAKITVSNAANSAQIAKENAVLKKWKQRAEKLQAENSALRRLLQTVPTMHHEELTVKLLGSTAGPYSHQYYIAAGSQQGVGKEMAVVNAQGLVGRVMSVSANQSSIMALTDIHSRIAVVTGKSREHAVVKGLGEPHLGLFYLPEDTQVAIGEKLYSSGDSSLMPAGILVGTVASISREGVKVIPAIDKSRLDFVRLILAQG